MRELKLGLVLIDREGVSIKHETLNFCTLVLLNFIALLTRTLNFKGKPKTLRVSMCAALILIHVHV